MRTPAEAQERAADWIAKARAVLVITGAGLSAASGIPTFRGKDGWWKNHDPMTLASPEGFAADPALVWEWYVHRISLVRAAEPNPAHEALARLERLVPSLLVLTQNVDGLQQRAGSQSVHEIHGSILRARCTRTGRVYSVDELDLRPPFPVKTPDGALARPDVVWFGEPIRTEAAAAVEEFLDSKSPGVCLTVGTTALFSYIQSWALRVSRGGRLVEINPEPTGMADHCDEVLALPAAEVLPRIADLVAGIKARA
ncbi:NAD-dependent protein deacylase [Candidatus Poribacteria bacterium]|nr:NAD-dependent protein deacylase [Candidatus Poribacteria bacterium]